MQFIIEGFKQVDLLNITHRARAKDSSKAIISHLMSHINHLKAHWETLTHKDNKQITRGLLTEVYARPHMLQQ